MQYIGQENTDECIFCTLPAEGVSEKSRVLFKGPLCFVLMNLYPYNSGHVMVSPYRHLACITLFDEAETRELNTLVRRSIEIIREVHAPDGVNVGLNLGKAAGAGIDEHVHTHIVPRWTGDTNFMPVLGETKVHPEHLQATYEKFLPHFQKLVL